MFETKWLKSMNLTANVDVWISATAACLTQSATRKDFAGVSVVSSLVDLVNLDRSLSLDCGSDDGCETPEIPDLTPNLVPHSMLPTVVLAYLPLSPEADVTRSGLAGFVLLDWSSGAYPAIP